MPGTTNIEWTDKSWNPTVGCTQISPGCAHCYAKTMTERFHGPGSFDTVVMHDSRLKAPFSWKKPARVFVNSMSDLFHEDVPFSFVDAVFAVMALTPQHTYQVLTKRPERMRAYMTDRDVWLKVKVAAGRDLDRDLFAPWPLPNVWLGVTVENQRWADERIPILLDTPAAVRFISAEPLLGPLKLEQDWTVPQCKKCEGSLSEPYLDGGRACSRCYGVGHEHWQGVDPDRLSWVIVGGESGSRHRPFDQGWARDLVKQCRDASVSCFVKQLGGSRPGNKMEDLPIDLQVREFPDVNKH
jgi:protein gp37